jgi:hypothetical protein
MSTAASTGDTGRTGSGSHTGSGGDTGQEGGGKVRKAGLFDIRTFIAALLGFDGIVILLMGIFGDQSTSTNDSPPININLWAGLGLIVTAIVFETWKRLRPVKVAEPPPGSDEAPSAAH